MIPYHLLHFHLVTLHPAHHFSYLQVFTPFYLLDASQKYFNLLCLLRQLFLFLNQLVFKTFHQYILVFGNLRVMLLGISYFLNFLLHKLKNRIFLLQLLFNLNFLILSLFSQLALLLAVLLHPLNFNSQLIYLTSQLLVNFILLRKLVLIKTFRFLFRII